MTRLRDSQLGDERVKDIANYINKGKMWEAFESEKRVVLLIDEIDKAESDVPNGLLEALGSGGFTPLGRSERVEMSSPAPLVVITTNEERMLPDAFVRRCVVLHLVLPKDCSELEELLIARGRSHFKNAEKQVLTKAAEILSRDRLAAVERSLKPLPGQAEYLDLLRSVTRQHPNDSQKQLDLLESVANYVIRKPLNMQDQSSPN